MPMGSDQVADVDILIVGAGVTGIYQLYRAREAGYSAQLVEAGSGVGGTWYWNRYPGARYDSESYTYGYLFSEELFAEWDWTEHFAGQPENERYFNHVVDKFDLRRHIRFNTRVTSAVWDESDGDLAGQGGRVRRQGPLRGRRDRRALGPVLSRHPGTVQLPRRGLPHRPVAEDPGRFHGQARRRHRHRVERRPGHPDGRGRGRLADRVPAHAQLGHPAQQPADHAAGAGRAQGGLRDDPRHLQQLAVRVPARHSDKLTFDDSPEERQAFYERVWQLGGFGKIISNYRDMTLNPAANAEWSRFVAAKIRAAVSDPATAEKLIPTDHGYAGKRPPYVTDYYEAFNRPNV